MFNTQLFYTLVWPKEPPPLVDHLASSHLQTLTGWMEQVIWFVKHNEPDSYNNFASSLGAITSEEQNQFLLAPSSFPLLRAAGNGVGRLELDICKQILSSYRNDVLLARQDPEAVPGWSRLSDFVQESDGQRRYSDQIGDSIIIDFDSDQCLRIERSSSVMCREPVPFTDEEREAILSKLRNGLNLIDDIAGTAGRLIRNSVRCIRVRKSTALHISNAETSPSVIGEVRLHNPHKSSRAVINTADALIHEALHNFIHMYELQYGGFVRYEQTALVRPVSPWTGNPIPYNAFTHAVLIYFALFSFYRLLYQELDGNAERKKVSELMTKCSRGFRLANLSECLSSIGSSPAWLFDIYQKMTDEICQHYAHPAVTERQMLQLA